MKLKPGTVLRYPYLWKWQSQRQETEGRKIRPVCVLLSVVSPKDNKTHVMLLAISSQPPIDTQNSIQIPETERRRAGLSEWKDAWITISEYNYDVVESSFYFEPDQIALGRFGKAFMTKLA